MQPSHHSWPPLSPSPCSSPSPSSMALPPSSSSSLASSPAAAAADNRAADNSAKGPAALVYLACDIGGTNSRLLLVERRFVGHTHTATAHSNSGKQREDSKAHDTASVDEEGCVERVLAQKIYPSEKYSHLNVIINQFLSEHSPTVKPTVCVAAVAGPVLNNACEMTNLNWFLKGSDMEQVLGISRVIVLNDFVAVGYGLLSLHEDEKQELTHHVPPIPRAPIACLGAGTGLGECFLTHNGREYDVWPTEGGHCSFAPRNDFEYDLLKHVQHADKLPTVSVERLCCGPAFIKIYQFFAQRFPNIENRDVTHEIQHDLEKASFKIAEHALKHTDTLCTYVLDAFVKIYGAEAGNLALKTMPFGGVYVVGNVANQIVSAMVDQDKFVENMVSKGRLRKDLVQMPVYLVKNRLVGLLGARVQARRLLREAIARQLKDLHIHPIPDVYLPFISPAPTASPVPRASL